MKRRAHFEPQWSIGTMENKINDQNGKFNDGAAKRFFIIDWLERIKYAAPDFASRVVADEQNVDACQTARA